MKSKIFLMSIVLVVFTAMNLKAQRGCMNQRPDRPNGPNPEMKAYIEENVLPVMKIQRQELEKQIEVSDKARLEEIRADLKSMRTMMKDKRDALRQSDEKPTVEQRAEMREHRDKMHKLMNEVAIMSEKYDAAINSALENIEQNAETWKNEMMTLRQSQNGQRKAARGDCPNGMGDRPGRKGNQAGPPMAKEKGMPFQRLLNPEGFLLWNTDEPLPMLGSEEDMEDNLKVNLYPNPASESVQVSLTLDQDESVSINIVDKDGKVVIEGKKALANAGDYLESFNLSKLNSGIYFVKIQLGTETMVERLIIQ
ncbi:MAG: T9SS type A sorting domain-containing protein [Bacteroidales bacterium]|nr:T9SS type A sorting domain-containing protein [Bacteroidales bacterium]